MLIIDFQLVPRSIRLNFAKYEKIGLVFYLKYHECVTPDRKDYLQTHMSKHLEDRNSIEEIGVFWKPKFDKLSQSRCCGRSTPMVRMEVPFEYLKSQI